MKRILYFIVAFFFTSVHAQEIIISIAGNTTEGYDGNDSLATQCLLHWPESVALDKAMNVYIADANNNVIRKISAATGKITTVVGDGFEAGTGLGGFSGDGGPASAAVLFYPSGIAFDTAGNLYIADQYNNRVRMVNTSGTITTIAGIGSVGFTGDGSPASAAQLYNPTRVATDTFGNIYIADAGNNVIRQINSMGIINTIAGTGGTAGYGGDGGPANMALLSSPRDMAVDDSGYVYIADYVNNRIRKIDLTGNISTIAGIGVPGYSGDSASATAANIFEPSGIALDTGRNIYFSDFANSRIRRIDTNGIITTIAGNGVEGYYGDGRAAIHAEMKFPEGLAVDKYGSVYFADKANNRIRFISGTLGVHNVTGSPAALEVYPDPNRGAFTVSISSAIDEQVHITITNMAGQVVSESVAATNHSAGINLSAPPGIYILTATTSHSTVNQKLIVQ